jgi:hypothetical protein
MVKRYGLQEVLIPDDEELGPADSKTAKCNIFMTPDFVDPLIGKRSKNALVLIQGTGEVRAG